MEGTLNVMALELDLATLGGGFGTGAVEWVTGVAAAGAELDGERSLSLASSELSELNPSRGISRMIGKEGGGAEDSFGDDGFSIEAFIEKDFVWGKLPETRVSENEAIVDRAGDRGLPMRLPRHWRMHRCPKANVCMLSQLEAASEGEILPEPREDRTDESCFLEFQPVFAAALASRPLDQAAMACLWLQSWSSTAACLIKTILIHFEGVYCLKRQCTKRFLDVVGETSKGIAQGETSFVGPEDSAIDRSKESHCVLEALDVNAGIGFGRSSSGSSDAAFIRSGWARTDDGDGMISCVVEDCDELTQAACQSLVILNDGGWIGIAVNGGKVVEKEVKISGDGDWSVMVLEWMKEEDVECGELDVLGLAEGFLEWRLKLNLLGLVKLGVQLVWWKRWSWGRHPLLT
ncbi:unnamed protein product [Cladocopium goreaui]|uniref:Uncharacterized protein n=1 Tax=Cladocopium goreaui TaxID=2562237 RepID=A0A9P1G4Y2_9DINO|nr:unnamed protein product [Cladocopium goreaui]